MDSFEDRLHNDVVEGLNGFVGTDFSFGHLNEDGTINVTEYTEEGEIPRHLKMTISLGVEVA